MARAAKKETLLTPEEKLAQALVPEEEQPYQIPKNWCWARIGAVSSIYTGNSINETIKKEKYYGQPEGLLYIATKDIEFDGTIDYDTNVRINDFEKFKIAPANTALLCIEGGSAGRKVGFVSQKVCFVNKLCAFVANTINAKYIYYYLLSQGFLDQFNARKHGLIGGVSVNEISTISIAIPPLAEQQRIVACVESLFAKLDETKEKAQEVVDGFEDRKAAILHKAFTGELTAEWRKRHNVSCNDWKKLRLDEFAEIVSGFAFSSSDFKETNRVPCIKITNVGVGEFNENEYEYLPKEYLSKYERYNVKQNDILISLTRSYITSGLKVCIYPNDEIALLNQRVALIRNCNIKYAFYYLTSESVLNYVKEKSKTTNQPNLSIKDLCSLMLPVPIEYEQNVIVGLLESILEKEKQAKETAEQVVYQIDAMKKTILARAFRGELGTNDPADESAEELLKRVL